MVPVIVVPGRVPAEGGGLRPAAAGTLRKLHAGILLCLQGQLAPRPGVSGKPTHHSLSAGREQVPISCSLLPESHRCVGLASATISHRLVASGVQFKCSFECIDNESDLGSLLKELRA